MWRCRPSLDHRDWPGKKASRGRGGGVVRLDVGSDAVSVFVLAADGRELDRRGEIPNSDAGASRLINRLTVVAAEQGITRWRIGLEASSSYWRLLAIRLSTGPGLPAAQVYTLTPTLVKDFRSTVGGLPKTDRHNAYLIAERVRFDRGLPTPLQRGLALRHPATAHQLPCPSGRDPGPREELLPDHALLTLQRVRAGASLCRPLWFHELGSFEGVHDPGVGSSCDRCPGDLVADQGTQTLQGCTGHGDRPPARGEGLVSPATRPRRSHAPRPGEHPGNHRHATAPTQGARSHHCPGIPQMLESIPGLGRVWTAGLVAEIGEISRFPDEVALAQFAGLSWTVHENGHFQAEDTGMTMRGNPYRSSVKAGDRGKESDPARPSRGAPAARLAGAGSTTRANNARAWSRGPTNSAHVAGSPAS